MFTRWGGRRARAGGALFTILLVGCSGAGTARPAGASGGYYDAVEGGASGGAGGAGSDAAPTDASDAAWWLDAGDGAAADAPLFDGGDCDGPGARFVTGVLAVHFGPGQNLGQDEFPQIIYGPPKGGGALEGSTDTVSLGNGGWVEVEFQGNAIVDGPGPDFIVFENPFYVNGNPNDVYAELGTVAVSADGVNWVGFPCTATAPPYGECAGWHPVYANPDTNHINPLDPSAAGGDAFDLADIGVKMARYVRVTDRADLPTVFDLDAVGIVNALCP
jgi:hypothetical protein